MSKEIKKTVACPACGKEVTVTVISGNGSEVMTKESIEEIFSGMSDLLVRKNQDYKGASFDLGLNGNMVHLWDKVRRYRNMVENPSMEINFESAEDTLKDIIGYAVIGLHILKAER
jgi:hypothetical protein